MYRFLLAMSLGLLLSSYSARLPTSDEILFMCGLLAALIYTACHIQKSKTKPAPASHKLTLAFLGLVLGVVLALVRGQQLMSQQLPAAMNGREFLLAGEIVGLPKWQGDRWSFYIRPRAEEATNAYSGEGLSNIRKIHLSWRPNQDAHLEKNLQLVPGHVHNFRMRLRRPRGFVNPGGFDYQAWKIRQGVGAQGYLLSPPSAVLRLNNSVDHLRYLIRLGLHRAFPERKDLQSVQAYTLALLIGDKSAISQDQWAFLQKTGTLHLMAISGMHIGIAAFLGHFLGALLGRFGNLINTRISTKGLGALGAIAGAGCYSALAGFSLPTQRALLMLLVYYLSQMFRRPQAGFYYFFWALVLVLILDPLAPLDTGFCLSFGAVFCLLLVFSGRREPGSFKALVKAQGILFVGLAVPLSVISGSVSLIAPIANIVAIPMVSMIVVPALFVSVLFMFFQLDSMLAQTLTLVLYLLSYLMEFLKGLDALWIPSVWQVPMPLPLSAVFSAAAGSLLFLLPKGIPGRHLGLIGFLPLCLSGTQSMQGAHPPLKLTVLDLGQGLAVHIQTARHHLLYDTGPRYGDQFDSGKNILLPYFRRQGIEALHSLIVSHEDNDHAGGAAAIRQAMSIQKQWQSKGLNSCHEAKPWELDGVKFVFLGPKPRSNEHRNNLSCVLFIRWAQHSVLLTGDIDQAREQAIVAARPATDMPLSLMLSPHHGSKTSSSYAWLYHWGAERVIYSTGFENRYGHPHTSIVERYRQLGTEQFNTAESGAISFEINSRALDSQPQIRLQRVDSPRYWYTADKTIGEH